MWKDNLKSGDGKLIKANGDKYIGEFFNDKINGKGEYIYSNGDKYIGEFKDNVFHGHGCYINANGDTYEGEYRYGLKKGYGILKSIGTTVYEGEFKDDLFEGRGRLIYKNEGKYEGLWTTFLIKPLAFFILQLGKLTKNYALAVILITLIIRLICYPFTRKTAMQSELMKQAQPEMQRIQKKYAGKQDEKSMMMQSQEMLAIYKKYNISPASGCLFSLIQLPLFLAFYESVQRIPAIFEGTFLGLQLGTTPTVGITTSTFYIYIILMILISLTTYYSFKMNMSGQTLDPAMKNMPIYMSVMIIVTALFMPSALCIYWLVSNLCTIFQNMAVKKNKVERKRS